MKKEDLKNIFKEAAGIASVIPENMQQIAFNRVLEILLSDMPKDKTRKKAKRKRIQASQIPRKKVKDEQVEKLLLEIDSTKYPAMNKLEKNLERSLLVLKIARNEFKIDGLTSPQVARILTDKFRLRTTRQAVEIVLRGAGNFVDRVPAGRAFKYRIMQPGEEFLNETSTKKEGKK